MKTRLAAGLAALALISAPQAYSAPKPPATWDGLDKVPAKRQDAAYLAPGADFKPYTKVMLDPTEVAFQKNWLRDYNDETLDLAAKISESDAKKMLAKIQTGFEQIFTKAYTDAGYQVVTEPGPDVLRLRTAVLNLSIAAPDRMTPNRTVSFSRDAGTATLVLEARDSMSGAILGRGVDGKTVGDNGPYLRNSVTNRGDFSEVFQRWAKISVNALAELKAGTPPAP